MRKLKKNFQKNFQKNSKLKERGITLIALVITIIILIILATISITLVFGEGGLIQRAQEGKALTEQAQKDEQDELLNTEAHLNELLMGSGEVNPSEPSTDPTEQTPTPIEEITKGEIFEETTKVEDVTDDTFYVPGGFGIDEESPDEIDEGIVISNADDTKQFVWIPVADYTTMYQEAAGTKLTGVETTTDVYSKLRAREEDQGDYTAGIPNSIYSREPDLLNQYDKEEQYYKDILGYNSTTEMVEAFVEEYEATYNSIKKYKGFYIGRYELTGSVENPTVQKNQTVLSSDIAENWYYLKKACTNVVSSEHAQTTMIYGNQWDETMSWLVATGDKTEQQVNENSADWGNYNNSTGTAATNSGSPQVSGKNEAWKANNIYDLAGNYLEWTQEAYSNFIRVCRGGYYEFTSSIHPASSRYGHIPDSSKYHPATRPALYIK